MRTRKVAKESMALVFQKTLDLTMFKHNLLKRVSNMKDSDKSLININLPKKAVNHDHNIIRVHA